ncbi:UNVERIFIED_CONTAM: hypothetical protein NCL1_43180 [Trichonephila clavipes]
MYSAENKTAVVYIICYIALISEKNFRFTASSDEEVLKLSFEFFRMERINLCNESLKLYDSPYRDPSKIMSKLCDINRPRTEHPRMLFVKTRRPHRPQSWGGYILKNKWTKAQRDNLYEGSSISYAFEVRPVNVVIRRNNLSGRTCSRVFTPESGLTGLLTGQPFGDSNSTSLSCNYTFDATRLPQGRVRLDLYTSLKLSSDCAECRQEPLYAQVILSFGERICFCKSTQKA